MQATCRCESEDGFFAKRDGVAAIEREHLLRTDAGDLGLNLVGIDAVGRVAR